MTPRPAPIAPLERPRSLAELGFERKPMVSWLSPRVLVEAGLRVVVSSLFGQYADKRELQAVLDPTPGTPLSYGAADKQDGALWLDFVADLGDGFDSTYAVACLLGRRRLELAGADSAQLNELIPQDGLPRGRALIMGGDEVYPVATREEYENRFRWPYTAACPTSADPAPDLLAIPGNHDWYDGLTNFLRFFCAGREIGGWQTQQRRSYFALQLPHRWWLLAIDIQLDTYIDDPQLAYFQGLDLQKGDQVILVTGKPSWVKVRNEKDKVPSYQNIEYFEEKVVKKAEAEVRVTLTGDLHHYCRYQATDGDHNFITSGGGGAYLFPTHTMPETLKLPEGDYAQESPYPDTETSEALTKGAKWLFRLAPGLCATIAVLYAGFAASLFAAIEIAPGWSIASATFGVTMLLALVIYAAAETTVGKGLLGTLHCVVHLLAAAVPAVAIALLADSGWLVGPVAILAGLIGFFVGGLIFGEYLIISHKRAPKHANEVLACQGIPDYKNFLRLRVDENGLTIYPIGIDRVPRQWEPDPDAAPEQPWLRPVDHSVEAHLIEPPLRFPTR